mmetsp:Transcript_4083/g.4731  ORF Transcript_4083/g.4731 Transcript_4083/m.4731 type:complete len:441 (-) Transcript_4083:118-1440(-)|eukprot:CAMPEP_0204825672 /NCGR_PEP_ID=MMETSP1346-20131115/3508_1 /ASSEMBLY_ACC=CAM_ASM_000771 /TAXON_ID=215587 /ORGANISM="Aplanochytrium stocchinoi, Strain GSBS06" /LENGTH=440 /DNA_ID=CAMNT_0051953381 /DNA_START=429 /DNA_END=1751 /DNA_ORIENTATION=-
MDHNGLLNAAKATVSEAIELDKEGMYEKAYAKYQRGLEQFLVALKYEKNPSSKEVLTRKVQEYMDRAEVLKAAIKEGRNAKPQADGANGGSGDGVDKEKGKLRGALAGAIVKEKPNVAWDDVAGLEGAKEALKEAVILPAKFPQLFTGKRRPWKGILLYGPPGTGKSYLAKAVATEADSVFYSVSSSDLVSKWQGESERLVRNLFELARESAPSIIFIDEIDSLCGARGEGENESARRIKTEFLVQMQGVGNKHDGILVLGATNLPWALDPAMRRRFEKRIYIPLPTAHARAYMFRLNVGDTPNELTEADYKELGEKSKGFSGSDVSVTVREALMLPLREAQSAKFFREEQDGSYTAVLEYPPCPFCPMEVGGKNNKKGAQCEKCGAIRMNLFDVDPEKLKVPPVSKTHFFEALSKGNSSVSTDELGRFEEWTQEFGQEG